MTPTRYSIIIPAYNEGQRIGPTLEALAAYLESSHAEAATYEVFVVCDGCKDDTERTVRAFERHLPLSVLAYRDNRGKGYAVKCGVAASTGQVVAFMDADGSTPVGELRRLARPIIEGQADIVIGSRRANGAGVTIDQPITRQLLGRAFAWHARAVLGLRMKDTQCGFKVFDGEQARELFGALRCDGFAFDLEILALARERGLRMLEAGVRWHEVAGSTVHPLRDGTRMLRAAWQIRSRIKHLRRNAAPCRLSAVAATRLCKGTSI